MYRIIGSLLLVSLLSRPAILRVDYLAYEVYKSQSHIIAIVRRIHNENEKKSDAEKIAEVDGIMADIDNNTRTINSLLKTKNSLLGQIQTSMSLKAQSKEEMTEEQIESFQKFYSAYAVKSGEINDTLADIERRLSAKNVFEIIRWGDDTTGYDEIASQLKEISDRQYEALLAINGLIEHGEKTLTII